jgi:hypothetical protein
MDDAVQVAGLSLLAIHADAAFYVSNTHILQELRKLNDQYPGDYVLMHRQPKLLPLNPPLPLVAYPRSASPPRRLSSLRIGLTYESMGSSSNALAHFRRAVAAGGKFGHAPSALRLFRHYTDQVPPPSATPIPLRPSRTMVQSQWDDAIAVLETSLVYRSESAAPTSPWMVPRHLPVHPDVLYRLTFQNRFSVHLKHYYDFRRLIRRVLDLEIAWRPWFNLKEGRCAASAGSRGQRPRVCEVLDAHASRGVSMLHAFGDDFSYMTPLQTLMLVSDSQACRHVSSLPNVNL